MPARSHRPARPEVLMPRRALLACEPFGLRLAAEEVAAAIAAGLRAGGQPPPDVLALDPAAELAAQLAQAGFDARMHVARAVVLAAPELDERTLAASPAFEIATRARQAGVPAYAVTAADRLGVLDARILDLQLVLRGRGRRGLQAAGRRLASALSAGIPDTRT